MESEGVLPEQSESELPRDVSAIKEDEITRMEDSDGEEDVQEDIGALSSDDEDFFVGKKKPISKGRPRKKTQQAISVFPEPQVHHVRENFLIQRVNLSPGGFNRALYCEPKKVHYSEILHPKNTWHKNFLPKQIQN